MNPVAKDFLFLNEARWEGDLNQAEMGAPASSAYGQTLRAAVMNGHVINQPGKRDASGRSVDARQFAKTPWSFRDFIGLFIARPASNRTIGPYGHNYSGILPLDAQPQLAKPLPWEDDTLGAP